MITTSTAIALSDVIAMLLKMAASANVLGCFWALCSTSDAERLTAANDLLELLCTSEVLF